jgi:hypothetical protein
MPDMAAVICWASKKFHRVVAAPGAHRCTSLRNMAEGAPRSSRAGPRLNCPMCGSCLQMLGRRYRGQAAGESGRADVGTLREFGRPRLGENEALGSAGGIHMLCRVAGRGGGRTRKWRAGDKAE